MALKYGIPPGNPTVVWDDIEGVEGSATSDPYVSWQYHLDRTSPPRGGVDMTASDGTPLYAPIDCRVEHYTGGAGIAVRMWAADGSGWSDVFDHLSAHALPNNTVVPFGGLVGYSGGTYGYAPHLHWHRLDPSGTRRIPWDYFTDGTTIPEPTLEKDGTMIIISSPSYRASGQQVCITESAGAFPIPNAVAVILRQARTSKDFDDDNWLMTEVNEAWRRFYAANPDASAAALSARTNETLAVAGLSLSPAE